MVGWNSSEIHCSELTRLLLARGNPLSGTCQLNPSLIHTFVTTLSKLHWDVACLLCCQSQYRTWQSLKCCAPFSPNVCDTLTKDHTLYRCWGRHGVECLRLWALLPTGGCPDCPLLWVPSHVQNSEGRQFPNTARLLQINPSFSSFCSAHSSEAKFRGTSRCRGLLWSPETRLYSEKPHRGFPSAVGGGVIPQSQIQALGWNRFFFPYVGNH